MKPGQPFARDTGQASVVLWDTCTENNEENAPRISEFDFSLCASLACIFQATAKELPHLWKPSSGLPMANDVAGYGYIHVNSTSTDLRSILSSRL
ncbi:uncharacterized protein LOC108197804 [Daucus carota subsp. sativus]|uniref:uncharacterized protein LOC108197804 n=1 Tax=Daucus carota subsp. sativus TaxID=79200 RepID=UPI0030827E41